jgi:hypothetical protein
MEAISPTLPDKNRLSPSDLNKRPPPEVETNLPIFDPHDEALAFEDRTGNQPDRNLKRQARKTMQRSSDEYGIFSPIYKKEGENPFNPRKGSETDEQVRDRLASYVKNTEAMTEDHVATILKEDQIAEDFARYGASGMGVQFSRSVSKNTKRGTLDQVDELLTLGPGPQPEFTTTEFERKAHLKEMLQKRKDESVAELRGLHSIGSHDEHVRTDLDYLRFAACAASTFLTLSARRFARRRR